MADDWVDDVIFSRHGEAAWAERMSEKVERDFVIKDSGKRAEYSSGMVRDTEEGKVLWTLILDGPMAERYAVHLTKGLAKYGRGNWLLANSAEEEARYKESAFRHMIQWLRGDTDEDHAAAVWFNINGAENVRLALRAVQ